MTIDNLIEQLKMIREQRGNISVRLLVNNNSGQTDDVRGVELSERQVTGWDRVKKEWKNEKCNGFVLITT